MDGQGTCLTTEECLLNPNRNPHLSRAEIEAFLGQYLNVETVIWLGRGVHLDETDGHVDNLCAFKRPGEVVLTWTDDRSDPQYDISRDAHERLMAVRHARGRRFKVHKLIQPGPLHITPEEAQGVDAAEGSKPREPGARMAASYVNFYLGTRRIVVPLLDPKRDGAALRRLKALFPRRDGRDRARSRDPAWRRQRPLLYPASAAAPSHVRSLPGECNVQPAPRAPDGVGRRRHN